MKFETPTTSVLYLIEQSIKEYRKLCQKNVQAIAKDLTVDQALVLIVLEKDESLSQNEVAELVFKDNASITRMIELMVKNDYLTREMHKDDRRKFQLSITKKGQAMLKKITPAIAKNRETALKGLSDKQLKDLYTSLLTITENCRN